MVSETSRHKTFAWLLCALVGLTGLAYAQVVQFDFTNFDDPKYIHENPQVLRGLTWEGVRWAFTSGYMSNWHPVTWLSHQTDVALFGLNAGAHHVVSVVIHCLNVGLAFWLFVRLTGSLWGSAFVAGMFGLHPLHVESVAWVAERKDVLSACFGLLTLLAYQRYVQARNAPETGGHSAVTSRGVRFASAGYYSLALFLFALGLMSKPMLVTLPVVMLLLDLWPLQRINTDRWRAVIWPLVREKTPFFALSLLTGLVTIYVQSESGAVRSLEKWSIAERLANSLSATLFYLVKTVRPENLAPFYPLPQQIAWWPVGIAVAVLLGITAWTLATIRKAPYRFVGWFWFLIMLAPVIGILQVGLQQMADRYTYLPHLGLFAWVAAEAVQVGARRPNLKGIGVLFVITAVLNGFSATRQQVTHWRDSGTLFRHALAVTDRNMLAHNNLGYFLYTQGDLAGAIAEYEKAIAIMPQYTDAHSNLGRALADQKRYTEAEKHFETVLRISPRDVIAHNNLGNVLAITGRHEAAIEHFRAALAVRPEHVSARINWGLSAEELGRGAEAAAQYREVLRLMPDALGTINSLAWLLATHPDAAARNGPEAAQLADRLCLLTDCSQPLLMLTLAAVRAELGEFIAATAFAEQALERARASGDGTVTKRATEMLAAFRNQQPYRLPLPPAGSAR